jgi:hypothetical protein
VSLRFSCVSIKQRLCCLGTGHHKHRSSALLDIHPQRNNLSYKGKRIVSATQLKYIVGNKIGKELLIEENIKLALKGTIKPIYNTEVSKKIPAKILAL